jgi:hypothetical protein
MIKTGLPRPKKKAGARKDGVRIEKVKLFVFYFYF